MSDQFGKPNQPKCTDCRTSVHVFPWARPLYDRGGGLQGYSYTWRCGPCQYKHEHPDAALTPHAPRKPKVPQAEVLF